MAAAGRGSDDGGKKKVRRSKFEFPKTKSEIRYRFFSVFRIPRSAFLRRGGGLMMKASILLIDDAEHIQLMLKLTLEFEGHSVATASNGREGMERAAEANYDLIFCDIDMPEMNGLEFVAHYRAKHGPATPIVMLTAEGNELVQKALAAGATAALHKPFEPLRVLKEVQKQVGGG
jgi:CheY-like chemotaxis protein